MNSFDRLIGKRKNKREESIFPKNKRN